MLSMVRSISLEGLKSFFEIGGVVLLFLTFAFAAVALIVSNRINARQSEQLRQFNLVLSEQQERAATAERSLLELQERLRDRKLGEEQHARFIERLKLGPRCPAQIFSSVNDREAALFAEAIRSAIEQAGWNAERFLAHDMIRPGLGLSQKSAGEPTPCLKNLREAFESAGIHPFTQTYTGNFPEGSVHVLVGQKPPSTNP